VAEERQKRGKSLRCSHVQQEMKEPLECAVTPVVPLSRRRTVIVQNLHFLGPGDVVFFFFFKTPTIDLTVNVVGVKIN